MSAASIASIMWGRAPIAGVDEGFLASISAVERARFASFASARRRAEFLAGRRAARDALATLLGPLPASLAIDRHADGAPHLVGLDEPVTLSITHDRTRALAVAARGTIVLGIDLCEPSDARRIRYALHRAFPRDDERARVTADDATLCAAWSIKEAVGKSLRMGMLEQSGFERIDVQSVDPPLVHVDGRPFEATIDVAREDDGATRVLVVGVAPAEAR